jgi:hypothetical protein
MDSVIQPGQGGGYVPRFDQKVGQEKPPVQQGELFVQSTGGDSSLNQANALKRMAASTRKEKVQEGNLTGSVELFSDLALNGPGSTEINYLGV